MKLALIANMIYLLTNKLTFKVGMQVGY